MGCMRRGWCGIATICLAAACGLGDDTQDGPGGGGGGPLPSIGFDNDAISSVNEWDGSIEILVWLSRRSDTTVTAEVELGGSATFGDDYVAGRGQIVILPGVESAKVLVDVYADAVPEDAETIEMTLTSPHGARLGMATHTITIRENLVHLPRVTFLMAASLKDEGLNGRLTVEVQPFSEKEITVDYIVGGTATSADHALQSGTLVIPAGVDSTPIIFAQTDDALDEDNETIIVTLSNPVNAELGDFPTITHSIIDNDDLTGAFFAVGQQTFTEGDAGMQLATAEIRLNAPSGREVQVTVEPLGPPSTTATAGVDYAILTPFPLVFAPGETSKTITIALYGDTVQDGSETLDLYIDPILNVAAGSVHRIRIENDECLGAGAFAVCPDTVPTHTLTLASWVYTWGAPCEATQPPRWIAAGQPEACFIVANDIVVNSTDFDGPRPVVLVALNSITVTTLLDVGSDTNTGVVGPGTQPQTCVPFASAPGISSGGAGGSFMTMGGNGGDHVGGTGSGGAAAPAVTAPTVLRGGCRGQQPSTNRGSEGGGAVYLIAGGSITVNPGATINASGAPGMGGQTSGGNGGGSGGMIVLHATSIVANQARLIANGGGGGEGSDDSFFVWGVDGGEVDFASPLTPATGGTGTRGGDGGNGAVQGIAAGSGLKGANNCGGGGGGGGLGYIATHPAVTGAIASPAATSF